LKRIDGGKLIGLYDDLDTLCSVGLLAGAAHQVWLPSLPAQSYPCIRGHDHERDTGEQHDDPIALHPA
jgi:hypothetical protein